MSRSLALILFLASLLLICPSHASAAIANVSNCKSASSGNTTTLNCTDTIAAANIVVMGIGGCWHTSSCTGGGTWTPTDAKALTWIFLASHTHHCNSTSSGGVDDGEICDAEIWCADTGSNSGSDVFTVNGNQNFGFAGLWVVELSGVTGGCAADFVGKDSGFLPSVSTNVSISGSSFNTQADIYAIVVIGYGSHSQLKPGAGFANFDASSVGQSIIGELLVTSSAGTYQALGVMGSTPNNWGLLSVALRGSPLITPSPSGGNFVRGVWFLDGSAGSTGGGGGGGTGGGGTEDLMDWVVMDARRTNHLTPGYSAHYLFGDTVATATAGTNFAWIKNSGGNPWDINHFDNRNILFWITENGEQAPTNASAYKRFISPVPIAPRYFTPGSTVTITTDGNNPIIRTINCEADHQTAINIGHIKGVTTGPASTAWGGDVGTADTITVNYYWGGTGSTYNTREREFLVKGFGRVGWDTAHWNGSSYVIDDSTTHNTLALGASPDPNFACGYTSDWWQLVNGTVGTNPNPLSITSTSPLPNASFAPYSVTLKAAGGVPPYSWAVSSGSTPTGLTLETTGTLDGTPTVAGTSTFTAQVTDSVAATFSKAFSITVIDSTTHSVDLSWSAGAGATSYNVYRSTVNGACSPSIASGCSKIGTGITQLSWSDANLVSGKIYFYVVTAVNSGGESNPSNQVSVTIP